MAFSDPITLENSANTAKTFTRTSNGSGESSWIETTSTPSEPRGFSVKHQVSGKGKDVVDRHLVSFFTTKLDAETQPRTAVLNCTVSVPRNAAITSTHVYDMIMFLFDLLSAGQVGPLVTSLTATNVDRILRNET